MNYQGLLSILDMNTVLWLYLYVNYYVYIVNNVEYDNLSTCFDHPIRSD